MENHKMSRNENEVFYKNLTKLNNMVSSMTADEAIDFLVESNVFSNHQNMQQLMQSLTRYLKPKIPSSLSIKNFQNI